MTPSAAPATGAPSRAQVALGARVQLMRPDGGAFETTGKAALLLAMVVLEGQAERRRMALLLWPDSPESQARNNLRTLVHRLNQRFGGELLTGAEHLRIDSALARVVLQDTEELLAALASGGAERCALLADAGIEADTAEALEQWLEGARQRLRRTQVAGLSEALTAALVHGPSTRAIALARACVQLEPLSEPGHRQLMDTLARCGDRAAALGAYEDCKVLLRRQLGVLPDTQTRTVQLRILQGHAQAQPATAAVTEGLTPLGGAARFPLVERQAVLTEVNAALACGQHVVLHGEAGVGKTRLLRALAQEVGQDREEVDAEQVAIRAGAREEPYSAVTQLLQEVQPRRMARIGTPEQIELARLAPLAFPEVQPSKAGLSAQRLHAALQHWVERLGQAGVRRLVLDDVHYADKASQTAFGALLAMPKDPEQPLPTLVLAYRSGEIDAVLEEALVAAQVRGQVRLVALPRLTLQGVQALLHAVRAGATEAQAHKLLQRTGGNPLFVIELMQHSQDKEAEASGATAGGLDALLNSRLLGCSEAAQQLASVAGVAHADFSVEMAEKVMGQPALALMPAWSELQLKGLFADHGLAHDLVREAVLAALPPPIRRTLHRQVARSLEGQGLKGTRVLTHWLAADDFDNALPHALLQLHATAAAGLSTLQLEVELLDFMMRLSDPVLLQNLWLTTEGDGGPRNELAMTEQWPRLEPLVQRVERWPPTRAAGEWLAFERSRLLFFRDRNVALSYALLAKAAEHMSPHGLERARTEVFLSSIANHLNGATYAHALRAKEAVSGLAEQIENARLLRTVEARLSIRADVGKALRSNLAVIRSARRRHDLGAVEAARYQLATQCMVAGLIPSACRYFRLDRRANASDEHPHDQSGEPVLFGILALIVGRFAESLRFLAAASTPANAPVCDVFSTLVWLRLGQWEQAKKQAAGIDLTRLENRLLYMHTYAVARIQIDLLEGVDPQANLRKLIARAIELGIEGINRLSLEWELALLIDDPHERMAIGGRMIDEIRTGNSAAVRRPRALLEVAEANAQAGSDGFRALALEAARDLRRYRVISLLHLPDGLVRCARLLEATDPAEAAALMHVARRWVLQALPHVPEFARASFVAEVPVNRLLLADDAAVAFLKGRT